MAKKKAPRALKDNEAKAVARMLRVSPQKLNLLAQLIRGKKVEKALANLEFSRKRSALDVKKTLESAIANAENNHNLDVDDLVVAAAYVGNAMILKRFSPRARGRAGRIRKPFAHLTIVVREAGAAAAQA
jgi:large subunit ribosomal protein L22